MHYIHEPGSFVPLVQIRQARAVQLQATPDIKALIQANGGRYDIEQDPLWSGQSEPSATFSPFTREEIAYYQCDHLGTPQELTDHAGQVAWSAHYKAWGEAKQAISEAGRKAGLSNPIRFQGQYWDEETGLHYNRYRYYDPQAGRFVSKDPIGLLGGINLQQYAPNPIEWVDPFGLKAKIQYPLCCDGSHGRSNKQERLRALAEDPLQPRWVRGWVRNEQRHIETGNRKTIRLPGNSRKSRNPGKELAHGRNTEAKDGYCYRHSELQDADLNKTQHKIGGY